MFVFGFTRACACVYLCVHLAHPTHRGQETSGSQLSDSLIMVRCAFRPGVTVCPVDTGWCLEAARVAAVGTAARGSEGSDAREAARALQAQAGPRDGE